MEDIYRKIWETARAAKHILLISHKKPDGDTLGAMVAFGNALDAVGVAHTRYCVDEVPGKYRFLPGAQRIISDDKEVLKKQHDLVIFFDSGDMAFAGGDKLVAKIFPRPSIINIDHHHTNTQFGDLNAVVAGAASTTEVVYRLLRANNILFDHGIATCLLTGLCSDTGNFSNPVTSVSALALGGELLSQGAKFGSIFRSLCKNQSFDSLKLWGLAMERLRYNQGTGIATTALFDRDIVECGSNEEAAEGISNFLSSVLNVPVILVLREAGDGKVKGSYRTTGEADISALAAAYGGGGHKKAAGFIIEGRIEEAANEWKIKINS